MSSLYTLEIKQNHEIFDTSNIDPTNVKLTSYAFFGHTDDVYKYYHDHLSKNFTQEELNVEVIDAPFPDVNNDQYIKIYNENVEGQKSFKMKLPDELKLGYTYILFHSATKNRTYQIQTMLTVQCCDSRQFSNDE